MRYSGRCFHLELFFSFIFLYLFFYIFFWSQTNSIRQNQNVAKVQQINGILLSLLLPCYHGFLRCNCCYFCWQRLDKTTNNSLEFACEMQSAKTKRSQKKRNRQRYKKRRRKKVKESLTNNERVREFSLITFLNRCKILGD